MAAAVTFFDFSVPKANAAAADTAAANRTARGAHDVEALALPAGHDPSLVAPRGLLGALFIQAPHVIPGAMFQTSFATLLSAPAAALGDRSAVCSFLLPAYANRLWPRLSPLFATLELELPGFRGWSHFT